MRRLVQLLTLPLARLVYRIPESRQSKPLRIRMGGKSLATLLKELR